MGHRYDEIVPAVACHFCLNLSKHLSQPGGTLLATYVAQMGTGTGESGVAGRLAGREEKLSLGREDGWSMEGGRGRAD